MSLLKTMEAKRDDVAKTSSTKMRQNFIIIQYYL